MSVFQRTIIYSVILSTVTLASADTFQYHLVLEPSSRLWLEGDSSLHSFQIEADSIELNTHGEIKAAQPSHTPEIPLDSLAAAPNLSRLVLMVPVEQMTSPTRGLTRVMRSRLKFDRHQDIVFELTRYTSVPDNSNDRHYDIEVHGELTIAGVTRAETLQMKAQVKNNHIRVIGSQKVFMTDFDIDPPTLFFGRLKTRDRIDVNWDIRLTVAENASRIQEPR